MLTLIFAQAGISRAATPAKTQIINQASLTYSDLHNMVYTAHSNVVETTVAAVSGTSLSPNELGCNPATDTFFSNKPVVKTFLLVNGGNEPDAFVITTAAATHAVISGITFSVGSQTVPAVSGSTYLLSPVIPANGSLLVNVSVDATGVAAETRIVTTLTVRSTSTGTQNGFTTSVAAQCGIASPPPVFTGLGGIGFGIMKLVNALPATQTTPGSVVTYSIVFTNSGGSSAMGASITDPLPLGLTYLVGSAKMNGTLLPTSDVQAVGQNLTILLGSVAPHQIMTLVFQATVVTQVVNGQALINTAIVAAPGVVTKATAPAALLIGNANMVFDGDVGANSPIAGAVVELLAYSGPHTHTTAAVPLGGQAIAPNLGNSDPFTTDASGTYALGLSPKQAGTYEIVVTAPGYVTRYLQVVVTADPTNSFYKVVSSSLDGQPIAAAGGYTLTSTASTLSATYALFGNIPMFRMNNVTIAKLVDRASASAGSRLLYTITVKNGASPLGVSTVVDELPPGIAYAPGTARIDGQAVEPQIDVADRSRLTWTFASLTQQHVIIFVAVILPSVGEESVLTNVVTVAAHVATSLTYTVGARATAVTNVTAGVFTDRTIIVGRVYVDVAKAGRFVRGDTGVAGVRVYLEDGEMVTTDVNGKYDFPSVRPGMHILRLDETTLPTSVVIYQNRRLDSEQSVRRLVHDAYDGGLLQSVDFAVEPK